MGWVWIFAELHILSLTKLKSNMEKGIYGDWGLHMEKDDGKDSGMSYLEGSG